MSHSVKLRLHWSQNRHNTSGQTPDKEEEIKIITVYVSGYTETDTTGILSPPTVWRFSVAADIDSNGFFLFLLSYLESVQTVVLCRFWLQCSRGLRVFLCESTATDRQISY